MQKKSYFWYISNGLNSWSYLISFIASNRPKTSILQLLFTISLPCQRCKEMWSKPCQLSSLARTLQKPQKQWNFCFGLFLCNQFQNSEPGNNRELEQFVGSLGVVFQMFAKIDVNGKNSHPLYKWLIQNSCFDCFKRKKPVQWNFENFVIDRQEKVFVRLPTFAESIILLKKWLKCVWKEINREKSRICIFRIFYEEFFCVCNARTKIAVNIWTI